MERAARLNEDYGNGSLTALPIIETQAGDISAYIPTNVISITDGQIFLKTDMFNEGLRPAVDSGLSVSRVGSAAQIKAMKQVSSSLKLDLAQYHEMEAFARFGSDLDPTTKKILDHGARLEHLLVQKQYQPMPVSEQVMVLYAAQHGYVDSIDMDALSQYDTDMLSYIKAEYPNILDQINQKGQLDDELEKTINTALTAFGQVFSVAEGHSYGAE